ncbi:hypothetical protein GE061_011944 [Apolygus lucorum]|uniref:Uncharacterized protein n=1 Tax=Apolygus lucorum TaxID=248454 RepID=A0A8S9XQU1_APOLU|nr:hypothetical protein GE061_011944 [Apolygus lucorum]
MIFGDVSSRYRTASRYNGGNPFKLALQIAENFNQQNLIPGKGFTIRLGDQQVYGKPITFNLTRNSTQWSTEHKKWEQEEGHEEHHQQHREYKNNIAL